MFGAYGQDRDRKDFREKLCQGIPKKEIFFHEKKSPK